MKKVRSLVATICSLALAIAMVVSSTGTFALAMAANGEAKLSLNVSVSSTVEYGDEFTVPAATGANVKVTAPDGTVVSETAGTVKALQLGSYVVEYSNESGASYVFKVQSSLSASYDLYVGEKTADKFYFTSDIPTYAKVGDTAYVPAAYVGETVDGEVVYSTKVAPAFSGVAVTNNNGTVTFDKAGIVFVTYQATVGNGTKVVSTVKEIKVQKAVDDTVAPTMTITNFPKTGQLNSKVTLPKATVTDGFDSAATVEITVLDPSGAKVKSVVVDKETGYATAANTDELVFDNANSRTYFADGAKSYSGMYFYPTVLGDYKVTYKAVDDAGNATDAKEYTIAVSDGKAPSVTYDASTIPSNWGWNSVSNADGELESNAINFVAPEFYDNTSEKKALTVTFTLTDPEGKTVVRFSNINPERENAGDVKYTSTNSIFGDSKPEYTFYKDGGFSFDINAYVKAIKEKDTEGTYAVTGNYTAYYTVKDEAGNTVSTSNYYINVVDDYTDEVIPSVSFDNVPDSVVLKEGNEFTVPTASFYSSEDGKLETTYVIKSGDKTIEVESGDVLTFENGKLGELEVTTAEITLVATAKSNAGNEGSKEATVKVVNAEQNTAAYTVQLATNDDAELMSGVGEINYGTLTVAGVTADDVKNVGVELGVKNADGEYLSSLSAEIYWAENTKIVRNITFTPTAAGKYYLEVRVFDVYGTNEITVYEIEIGEKEASGSIGSGASAGSLPTTAEIYTTVELANKSFTLNNYADYFENATASGSYIESNGNKYYVATSHIISGGRFSLMGENLVMMTAGTYRVTDRPIIVNANNAVADYKSTVDGYEAWLNSYAVEKKSITATQNSSITFETVGFAVPTYVSAENGFETVTLPAMAAYSNVANASEMKVEVEHSNGTAVKVNELDDGTYSFTPNAHGNYTVTYTAVVGGTSDSATYTIKVGDVTAPEFTLSATHEATATVGDTFEFLTINLDDATETGVTYLKSLIKDGSTVATVKTRTGKGENITFSESGTYQIKYEVTDANGNTSYDTYTITVTEESADGMSNELIVSIVLICVVVVLIAGVVIYVLINRKKKTTK